MRKPSVTGKILSPLEQLAATNQQLLKRRPGKARPIQPSDRAERQYRAALRELVREMARAVDAELTPVLRAGYTADSPILDRVIAVLAILSRRFGGPSFEQQAERLARSTLSMAEAETTQAFLASVNAAVGVDLSRVLGSVGEYLDLAVADNVSLIKSLSSVYFERIEQAVIGGMRAGESNTVIARRIQQATGATYDRAKLIARDQMAKANTDIARTRMAQAGIKRFRWSTSQDQRVSGNPAGRYPNAKIKCYLIARQDVGFGPGVYPIDKGATYGGESGLMPGRAHINCRCTMTPQLEGIHY